MLDHTKHSVLKHGCGPQFLAYEYTIISKNRHSTDNNYKMYFGFKENLFIIDLNYVVLMSSEVKYTIPY